ncbi:hypothetical protein M430DRAFT_15974 [Amorphotheca resinae ATCC 22711]|uniref:Uncharacterized protein n=1 Tax=Amorphotheca resinae ATCC 22711 TaxID=857342 RepID=A0A2T3BAC3_AMORE|nr:hypothetical protein M430DRAFT_15974 [Amorphotheca resinae ATCC 22711]PSS25248.1 hypothetical protein M430DRAFT_15974 [Amorphotheca resinae ATCC 22711]
MSSTLNAYDEYLAAIERGKRLCKELQSFVQEPLTYPTMQSLYDVEMNPLRINTKKIIQRTLAGCGLSTSEMMYIDVRNIGKGEYDDAAYANHFDGRSGVVVCSENYKDRDENGLGQRLWPSEILWQSWLVAVKNRESKPSDLHAVVRFRVVNNATKRLIWESARRSTCTIEGENGLREYTNWDQGYHAILGSPNGGSTMRMLLDHKREIGYRTVERVVVLDEGNLALDKPQTRSFLILLSPRRTPPTRIPRPTACGAHFKVRKTKPLHGWPPLKDKGKIGLK